MEGGARLAGLSAPLLDRRLFVTSADTLLPYRLAPNYRGRYAGKLVTTDAEGQRSVRPRLPAARPETDTIALLGDSQVFGMGVADAETTPSQLQDSLRARKVPSHVVSIAAPGYSSWNEYAALRDYLAHHRLDTVVLTYISNDPTFENNTFGHDEAPTRFHRVTGALYAHSYVMWAVSDGVKRLLHRTDPVEVFPPPSAAELAYSMTAVDSIGALCAAHGCRLLVALYRDNAYYFVPDKALVYERQVGRALTEHGVRWMLIRSSADHLRWEDARVTWNDGHSSPLATSYIVSDLLRLLGH